MKTHGVDVSHWEGFIDWQVASRWVPFVYYKCTDGIGVVDSTFEHNRQYCDQLGIPHAPYHYFQPLQDPYVQANWFISTAGKKIYKRYVVDVEEEGDDIPGRLLTMLLRCEQLTGIKPAIYTSPGFWNEFVKPKPAWARVYDLIVAHYTMETRPTLPIGWDYWTAWQYTDHYNFPGCNEVADGDWFNGHLAQARGWFGNYQEIAAPVYFHTRLRSHFDQLHIRKNPNTKSKEIDHLAKGEEIELEELGGKDVWVLHSRGWTCVEKDGYRYMEVVKS